MDRLPPGPPATCATATASVGGVNPEAHGTADRVVSTLRAVEHSPTRYPPGTLLLAQDPVDLERYVVQ